MQLALTSSSPSLLQILPEMRREVYTKCDLISLSNLCSVSRQVWNEIKQQILIPTNQANSFGVHTLSQLDALLAHTLIYGKQIKWLKQNLAYSSEAEELESNLVGNELKSKKEHINEKKILQVLRNCPNLAALFLKYGTAEMDYSYFFNTCRTHIIPNLPLLEILSLEDSSFKVRMGLKDTDLAPEILQ
jgi:hypothetical protein